MARPETHRGVEDGGVEGGGAEGDGAAGAPAPSSADVVRPGTGVVRPGTGVVRPGASSAGSADSAAKARAVVPDAPEKPLEPIRIVLPVIEVKPAKQGFLDRLVAPKPKKPPEPKKTEPKRTESGKTKQKDKRARGAASDAVEIDETQPVSPASTAPVSPTATMTTQPAGPPAPAGPAPGGPARPTQATPPAAAAPAPAPAPARQDSPPSRSGTAPPAAPPQAPSTRPQSPPPTRPQSPPFAPPGRPPRPGRPGGPRPDRGGRGSRPGPPAGPDLYAGRPHSRAPMADRRGEPAGRDEYGDWQDRAQPTPRKGLWFAAAAIVVVLAAGAGAAAGTVRDAAPAQWLAGTAAGPDAPVLAGLAADAPRPSTASVAARLGPLFSDAGLGGRVTASVVDVITGESIFERGGTDRATPASTAKLVTAAAVLQARGPAYRIPTRVVAGASAGEVILVGGGDPTLAVGATTTYPGAARLDLLAEQVKSALGGITPSRVIVDSSLFVGPTYSPRWIPADARFGCIANITALMTDGARRNPAQRAGCVPRSARPDLAAGQSFAKALGLPASAVHLGTASPGAQPLGEVLSPTIARLVEMMLLDSDNIIAESLARQIALTQGLPASFDGGAAATGQALADLGVPVDGYGLVDGSGLSWDNRVSAALLTAILTRAASPDSPQLRSIISGLPVAAYSGTLRPRYLKPNMGGAAAGIVRAKTGTLAKVNALAGVAVDADGRLLAFSIVADQTTSRSKAEAALDRIAAALASCGCS